MGFASLEGWDSDPLLFALWTFLTRIISLGLRPSPRSMPLRLTRPRLTPRILIRPVQYAHRFARGACPRLDQQEHPTPNTTFTFRPNSPYSQTKAPPKRAPAGRGRGKQGQSSLSFAPSGTSQSQTQTQRGRTTSSRTAATTARGRMQKVVSFYLFYRISSPSSPYRYPSPPPPFFHLFFVDHGIRNQSNAILPLILTKTY